MISIFKMPAGRTNRFRFFNNFRNTLSQLYKDLILKDSIFYVDDNIKFDEYGNPLYLETPALKE